MLWGRKLDGHAPPARLVKTLQAHGRAANYRDGLVLGADLCDRESQLILLLSVLRQVQCRVYERRVAWRRVLLPRLRATCRPGRPRRGTIGITMTSA